MQLSRQIFSLINKLLPVLLTVSRKNTKLKKKVICYVLCNYKFLTIFCCIFVFHYRVNTTPNSGKKRRIDCMENDLLDSAER